MATLTALPDRTVMSTSRAPHLRILLLEDDPADAELVIHAVRRAEPGDAVEWVSSRDAFERALDRFAPDIVLSDHGVTELSALDALRLVQAQRPMAAFLLVSGGFERNSAQCLKAGAADFISKEDLSLLVPAIRAALELRAPLRKLSPRQYEVLRHLATGQSMRQIAGDLKVSVKTVETHRAQVMRRLDLHDVATLVRYAVRAGVVPPDQ